MSDTRRLVPGRCFLPLLCLTGAAIFGTVFGNQLASAESVSAKSKQGAMHGFLVLKSAQGNLLAIGDEENIVRGDRVSSRLIFRFRDGSIDDETTVFTQRSVLRLVTDHHIQKGPSFPDPLDLSIDLGAKKVTWREMKSGKEEVKSEHMDLPPDLANGLVSEVLENIPLKGPEVTVPYLAGSSKPRLVKFVIKPVGKDTFYIAGSPRHAARFNLHVDIGGVAGLIAPVIGKQPPDTQVWVLDSEVRAFLRMDGPLYEQGPIWTMELASPEWSAPKK